MKVRNFSQLNVESICTNWEISPIKLIDLLKSRQKMFRQVLSGVLPKKQDDFCKYFSQNCKQCQKDFFEGQRCTMQDLEDGKGSTAAKMGWAFLGEPFETWTKSMMPNLKNKMPVDYGKAAIRHIKILIHDVEEGSLGLISMIYKAHLVTYDLTKSPFNFKTQEFGSE